MAEAKMQRYNPLGALHLAGLNPGGKNPGSSSSVVVAGSVQQTAERGKSGDEQLRFPSPVNSNRRSCVHCPGPPAQPHPPAPMEVIATLPTAPVMAATLPESNPTGGTGPPQPGCPHSPARVSSPARIVPAALTPGLAALLLTGNGLPIRPAASPGQCYNPLAATAPSEAVPTPTISPPPPCTISCSSDAHVDSDAALAMMLHEEELQALCKQEEEEQQHFHLLQQQEQERKRAEQAERRQQQQQQVEQGNQHNTPYDVMALLGTPAEIYEAQYGNGGNSSPDHPTWHLPSPEAPAVHLLHNPPTSTGRSSGSINDMLIAALSGNPSEAYQSLYAAEGLHAPSAPSPTTDTVKGEAFGTLSPVGYMPCTPQPTPEVCRSCPASPGLADAGTTAATVAAASAPGPAVPEAASHYTEARPRAPDLGVSEEELQQALQAEQQLMTSKAQTPTSPAESSSPSSPTDSYHQELEALVQFFPSIPHVELLGVLEAFQGDMMAANDFLIGQQDDAASLKLQQADQDAELARAMHEREEEEQARKREGLGLSESELADLLGTEAQQLASGSLKAGKRRKGRSKGNSSMASSSASPPNGMVSSNSANAEQDVWRARSIKQYAAGAALQRSSTALAQLELGQQAEGSGGSGMVCPGVFADAEAEQAVWQEVEANRNSRRVAILTKWFGPDVDKGLLIDVVNTCSGHLEQARQQLRALGLQEVEQPPPSPSPLNLTSKRLQQQQQQQQQRTSSSGAAARPACNRSQFVQAASAAAPHGLAAAAAKQRTWAAAQQQHKGSAVAGREDCSSEGEGSSLGERCAAEEAEADLDAAFEREWVAMLASGATPSKDDLHARTVVMYRVQRAEADRLHALRRSAQAAAQRAERKGQMHKALEMWQHVENLKAKCCAASTLAAEKLHAWRNASRLSRLEWDFHCLHVEEALPMLQRNMDAAAILPGRKEVRVITGRGVHSDGEPKLPSAMRDWLIKQGIQFQEHLGYFVVMLDPVNPTSVVSASGEG
mmetsp:Transcript_10943/g.30022  ORF Transcript_10943/g.30022 Transcript_10943/m.30022 type:complete len:1008 (+) Transcript_10943:75-3098(+)